jgi:hypothetical protein
MKIFGCDFSGAKQADKKICVCEAEWQENKLVLLRVIELEERLDLVHMIQMSTAPWGMDMPFSVPNQWVHHFGGWSSLLALPFTHSRNEFKTLFPKKHSRSNESAIFRNTDRILNAKSPISSTPLDMLGMIYGAFKVLHALRATSTANVYPFDEYPVLSRARLYEVYPRAILNLLELNHDLIHPELLNTRFQEMVEQPFLIEYSIQIQNQLKSEHQWDAVLACITMAYCVINSNIDSDWKSRPKFCSDAEWDVRYTEGTIIRITR